jgi:hypothetical protein
LQITFSEKTSSAPAETAPDTPKILLQRITVPSSIDFRYGNPQAVNRRTCGVSAAEPGKLSLPSLLYGNPWFRVNALLFSSFSRLQPTPPKGGTPTSDTPRFFYLPEIPFLDASAMFRIAQQARRLFFSLLLGHFHLLSQVVTHIKISSRPHRKPRLREPQIFRQPKTRFRSDWILSIQTYRPEQSLKSGAAIIGYFDSISGSLMGRLLAFPRPISTGKSNVSRGPVTSSIARDAARSRPAPDELRAWFPSKLFF